MNIVRKTKWMYIMISSVLSLLGIGIILFPNLAYATLSEIIGIILAVFGVIKFFGYFSKDRYTLAFQFDFALGIVSLILGILMMIHSKPVVNGLAIMIGMFILIDGAFKMQTALDAKKFGLERWWTILILGLICSLIGILLLFIEPSSLVINKFIGISFFTEGLQNIIVVIYTVKIKKYKSNERRTYG